MNSKHDIHGLGSKLGIIFGVTLFTLAIASMGLGVGEPIVLLLASLYKGYAATFLGALMGLIWGFIHGYVVGAIVVFVRKYVPAKL